MPIIQDVQDGPAAPGPGAQRTLGTAALLLTVALGVGLAACSDTPPGPVASDVPGATRAELRQGGTLRWAVDSVPATFNVFQNGADPTATLVAQATLPTLFRLDDHAHATRDPDFLTSADSTAPADGHPWQTVVYRLNPRARWSDGTPLSVKDFAAQWKALSGADSAYWSNGAAGYGAIASVTPGAGPHQVKVVFKQPYGQWRSLFTPLYPAAAMSSAEVFNSGSRDGLAVSAGPFRLQRPDRRAGTLTLVRNPSWWGDRARLDRIVLKAVPVGQRLDALDRGTLDVAALDRTLDAAPAGGTARPAADSADAVGAALKRAEALPGYRLHRAAAAAYTQLTLNGGHGPLADPRVRRAVARAVDRRQIADMALKPLGLPPVTLGNHLIMGDQAGYQDNTAALGGTDREAVARLLEAAGWKADAPAEAAGPSVLASPAPVTPAASPSALPSASGSASGSATAQASGSASATPQASASAQPAGLASPSPMAPLPAGIRTREGRPLTLDLIIPAGSATSRRIADALTAELAQVGIAVVPRAVDGAGFFADHVAAGDFDLAVFSWPVGAGTVADERPVYAKPQPGPDGVPEVGLNYARTGTDEIDRLLDEAVAAQDPAKANRFTQQADIRIWQEAHSVPLFQRPEIVAVRDNLAGVGAFGFATPRFQDIGFTLSS
ncbi:ABC transporter family substrate-binding protein [Peterkaempfera sp. SMS 1(5)a]|uniref:ABC transporter family substrate-binding protein n=1 Tax=Peterkaempfera podocarpi TaxID=3232308 RepID=UPI00366D6BA5